MSRIYLREFNFARAKAKALRDALVLVGEPQNLTHCQGAVAAALGYSNWAELKHVTESRQHAPSPLDDSLPPQVVEGRLAHQARIIAEHLGIDMGFGDYLAAKVRLSALEAPQGRRMTLARAFAETVAGEAVFTAHLEDFARRAVEDHVIHGNDDIITAFAQGRGIDEVTDIDFDPAASEIADNLITVEGTVTVVFDGWSHDTENASETFSLILEITANKVTVSVGHPLL
jgi:hypothetical protein